MEGVLTRVSGNEKLKKRWCVLEEGILVLFSDCESGRAADPEYIKGSLSLSGCVVDITDAARFQFQITHIGDKFITLRAQNAIDLDAWIKAISHAIELSQMPLPPSDVPAKAAFAPIKVESLKIPKSALMLSLNFEVVLQKSMMNGFGMVIEATPEGISVKAVNEGLTVLSIIPESVGTLQVGDRLLKIGDQDVHDWSIASITELISDERIPIMSTTRFSFSRKNHTIAIRPLASPRTSFSRASHNSNGSPSDVYTPREAIPSPRELFAQFNVLECGMCTESFEESGDRCPHVLSCGHSFCYKDLKTLLKVVSDTFRCPTCLHKSKLSQYDGKFPPKNFSMLEALRFEYKAGEATNNAKNAAPEEGGCSGCGEENLLVHCYDCNADFCSKCNITIHQPVKFKAHYRGAVEAPEAVSSVCSVHNEKLKVYCFSQSCQTPICVLCTTIGTHKSHEFRPIQDVFIQAKQDFKAKLNEELLILQEVEEERLSRMKHTESLTKSMVRSASLIREDFGKARKQLDELEQHTIDSLNAYAETASAPLKSDLAKINHCLHDAVSKKNSKLLFASSIRFMSELAAADQQMNNTYQTATSMLADFRAEDVQHPTGIRIIGRNPRAITIQNAHYEFSSTSESTALSSFGGSTLSGYLGSKSLSRSFNFSSGSFDEFSN